MTTRSERVVLETPRHRIVGDVNLPGEGYHARLSDLLNRPEQTFIPLVNAEIIEANGDGDGSSASRRLSFIAVSRDHIQVAYELDQ